ncbi:MAG: chemotaxis-specific protein-glutamate methyltransferase CheB, partial [Planctomycetia bacterium]
TRGDAVNALIVDDSKPARTILARALAALDLECHEAANGREALDLLPRIARPDVVTVNLHMPEMDGIELITRLRREPAWRSLKLVMVSGEQDPGRVAAALEAGADRFVAKPFTAAALHEAILGLGVGRRVVAPAAPIRVLVVDDSAVIRSVLSATLAAEPGIAVAATAADGRQALSRIAADPPDLVLLDVEMPVMDGITPLRELRALHPRLPVVMFSSLTERGAKAAIDALLAGANDYVAKPKETSADAVAARIREELVPRIRQLVPRSAGPAGSPAPAAAAPAAPVRRAVREPVAAVVVAVSTGGPNALAGFLPGFVRSVPVPVLVVQHMPPLFTAQLAERLARICGLEVREARHGEVLAPGRVLLAPGGRHMKVARGDGGVVAELSDEPPEHACRPAADPLFRTAAAIWGAGTLGVVLTGMGRDGLEGSRAIVAAGGAVIVQDEFTSTIWGMPGHVARAGLADAVLPLGQLGAEVALRVSRRAR